MDRIVIKNFLDWPEGVLGEALQVYPTAYDRYHNPFEHKYTMNKSLVKTELDIVNSISNAFINLESFETCWWISRLLGIPIEYADYIHYGGVFIYEPGDYLKPHVDAGRHPKSHQIKVATAVLYLTPAQIIFWKGDVAWLDQPVITQLDEVVNLPANSCLFFLNHDTAYHEVPIVGNLQRVCITVSYMAPPDFKDPRFMNPRTRAYFARHMSHPDSPELAELRQLRSSEEHHTEVYRV